MNSELGELSISKLSGSEYVLYIECKECGKPTATNITKETKKVIINCERCNKLFRINGDTLKAVWETSVFELP